MSDTNFRNWMVRLKSDRGPRPEWPLLLSWMLEAEFHREQQVERPYTGPRLLMDRDGHQVPEKSGEKRAAYGLCQRCWQHHDGCLLISELPVWLLSFEVPNQGDERGRRADIVGITAQGGLVVIEAKLGENGVHPPISALLEGLDYLACLTSPGSLQRLSAELQELSSRIPVPAGFENVSPHRDAQHAVIVLADQSYFDFHDRSKRSAGWREMRQCSPRSELISMRFAHAELDGDGYFSRDVSWLT